MRSGGGLLGGGHGRPGQVPDREGGTTFTMMRDGAPTTQGHRRAANLPLAQQFGANSTRTYALATAPPARSTGTKPLHDGLARSQLSQFRPDYAIRNISPPKRTEVTNLLATIKSHPHS